MNDKFDVIIVGGGVAGTVLAYLLAKDGVQTLLIERGNTIGAKNTSGGRIYAHSIEPIFPNFSDIAPIERVITREKLSFMTEDESVTMEYLLKPSSDKSELSYSVLRVKFDEWLGEMAANAGADIITGIRVDDLIIKDGKVCGIIAGGEEMEADVVVLADGANSTLCAKYDLGYTLNPHTCAVGAKEIIELGKERMQDIFNLNDDDGVAWLFAGSPSNSMLGGGFLYTNKTSISLGVVFGLHNALNSDVSVPQMLENFKNHPAVKPIIKNGKTLEYSAHIVPEGGLKAIKKLSGDGVIVIGDAAGLCLNLGYVVRGMDLAVQSSKVAAQTIIKAKQNGDFTANSLSNYDKLLKDCFVIKDMELYQNLPSFLDNKRIFNEYPKMMNGIMRDMFVINGEAKPLRSKIMPRLKEVGYLNLAKDIFKGVMSV